MSSPAFSITPRRAVATKPLPLISRSMRAQMNAELRMMRWRPKVAPALPAHLVPQAAALASAIDRMLRRAA